MGGACAPIRSPPGISGTGHPARVYPEAWQTGKAPVCVPCVNDRALQRSTAQVLSAIMVCRCDRTKVRELGYFRRHEARADRAPVGEIYRDGQVCVTRRWRKADSNHRATRCRNSVALAVYLRNVGQG